MLGSKSQDGGRGDKTSCALASPLGLLLVIDVSSSLSLVCSRECRAQLLCFVFSGIIIVVIIGPS